MPNYRVNTQQLRAGAGQLEGLRDCLDDVAATLILMRIESAIQMRAATPLSLRVKDCAVAAQNQSLNLQRLSDGLNKVATLYENCEKKLKTPQTVDQTKAEDKTSSPFWDTMDDWFSGMNTISGLASGIYNFAKGTPKGIVSGLKEATGVVKDISSAIDKLSGKNASFADWADEFIGFRAADKKTFGQLFADKLDDFNLKNKTTTAGKASVIAQWAGVALSAVGNGIENYNEFDGEMGARFWGETVIETGVDVAIGAAVGAAAGAVLGTIGAPALLVGAAAGIVVWGANEACKAITGGRDIGEVVADAACDFADTVVRGAKNVGKKIADGASAAWKNFCAWAGA